MTTRIRYTEGVPRWFARLTHMISVRRCRRIGHDSGFGPDVPVFTCVHCGQILREP